MLRVRRSIPADCEKRARGEGVVLSRAACRLEAHLVPHPRESLVLLVLVLLVGGCSGPAPTPSADEIAEQYLVYSVDGVLDLQPRLGMVKFHRLPAEVPLREQLVVDNVQLADGTAWLLCSAVGRTSAYRFVRGAWRVFDVHVQLHVKEKEPDRVYAEDRDGRLWVGGARWASWTCEPRWVWSRADGLMPKRRQEAPSMGAPVTGSWYTESLWSTPYSTFFLESSTVDGGQYRISCVAAGEELSGRQSHIEFTLPLQSPGLGLLGLRQGQLGEWSILLGIDTSAEMGRLASRLVYSPDNGESWRDVGGEEWTQRMVMAVEQAHPAAQLMRVRARTEPR